MDVVVQGIVLREVVQVKSEITWQGQMEFSGGPEGYSTTVDAARPLGQGKAMNPKQMLLVSICGCTGMDVVALMKKHKQPLEMFAVSAESELTDGYPKIFKVRYTATGAVEPAKLVEAADLSMNKYCGVSAMIAKACPIRYEIVLNNETIKTAVAHFEE